MTPALGDRGVALAFLPPALLGIGSGAVVAALMGDTFLRTVATSGALGIGALLIALVSTGIVSAAMGLGVARPVALAAAASSWIAASLASMRALAVIGDASCGVTATHRAPLFWAGYAEALGARVVVAPIAAALFAGIGLSALLRARGREERWSMLALAALAVAGAGLAAASASEASSLRHALFAAASASSRAAPSRIVAGMAVDQAQLAATIGLFVAAVGGIALVVIVALASARGANAIGGGIGGAGVLASALVVVVAPAFDVAVAARALTVATSGNERPWQGLAADAYAPLVLGESARPAAASPSAPVATLVVTRDSIVLGHDRIMTVSSTNIGSADVKAYVASLAATSTSGAAHEPPRLRIAFDERAAVAPVLAVAHDVGVSQVELLGVAFGGRAHGIAGRAAPLLVHDVAIGCASSPSQCIDATALRAGELVKRLEDGAVANRGTIGLNIGPSSVEAPR